MPTFNLSKKLTHSIRTAMPVRNPSPEAIEQMRGQGVGVARDTDDWNSSIKGLYPAGDYDKAGFGGRETMSYIPFSKARAIQYQGKTLYFIRIDEGTKKSGPRIIAYDPEAAVGDVEQEMLPGARNPRSKPSNFVAIPTTDPEAAEWLKNASGEFEGRNKRITDMLGKFNSTYTRLQSGETRGLSLTTIGPMLLKQLDELIPERIADLASSIASRENDAEQDPDSTPPGGVAQAEGEWLAQVNEKQLNDKDEEDTIWKLFGGREKDLLNALKSGTLTPSDAWRTKWDTAVEYPMPKLDPAVEYNPNDSFTFDKKTGTRIQQVIDYKEVKRQDAEKAGQVEKTLPPIIKFVAELRRPTRTGWTRIRGLGP